MYSGLPPARPITFSGSNVGLDTPAPSLGQDNEQIFREVLGYSDDRVAELAAASVI